MGTPLCFTHMICELLFIIYYFCRALIFEAEDCRPAAPLPGCRNVVQFYNRDQRGPYVHPLHFEPWCDFELM